jgi:hypothetical protein
MEVYTKLEACFIQVRSLLGAGKVLSNVPIDAHWHADEIRCKLGIQGQARI